LNEVELILIELKIIINSIIIKWKKT